MVKIQHNSFNKEFYITRESKQDSIGYEDIEDNLITIAKIKEVLKAIEILFNNPSVEILIHSVSCLNVEPIEKKKENNVDPIICKDTKVTKINNNTLQLLFSNYNNQIVEYKTKKINDSFIDYTGETVYMNMLERVTIKY